VSALVAAALFAAPLQAAPQAVPAPAPDVPVVTMDVAKARVATVKLVWAAIASGDEAALARVVTPTATADINGITGSLKLTALAPLKSCTRTKPYQVNQTDVALTLTCTGVLPTETTAVVVFDGDKVAQVSAAHTVFVPPAQSELL
jgi:hypothetical protein